MIEKVRNFSECYFGYKMDIRKDELNLREREDLWPRIYLEKKNNHPGLFFTFPDWFTPIVTNEEHSYVYEEVKIGFDPKGYIINNIIDRIEKVTDRDMFSSKVIKYSDECIVKTGRYDVNQRDCSGIGYISLKKGEKETIFYYAINYGEKKKIYFILDKNKIIFKTKNDIDNLKIRIYFNEDRLPCLANETESYYEDYNVCFKNHVGKIILEHEDTKLLKRKKNTFKYVDLGGDTPEEINKNKQMFLLIREEDRTSNKNKKNTRKINSSILCPYCHDEINPNGDNPKNGVFCDGKSIASISQNFVLRNQKNKIHTKYILCKNNYLDRVGKNNDRNDIQIAPYRLLPENILKKRNYRIAILGKARSGKSTYISRLLNITGSSDRIVIRPESNPFFHFYNISSYSSNLIAKTRGEGLNYAIHNTPYFSGKNANPKAREFFDRYSISFEEKKFIKPTLEGTRDSITEFPFILNVNNKAYVSIYDIAGEDVENGTEELNTITRGENTSVIIVLDISKRIEVNENILQTASSALINNKKSSPIAIVLSKFDNIEHEFNSNCACLRSDYNNLLTSNLYSSSLMHHIDAASSEIEAYLKCKGLDVKSYFQGFNVKFFSTSVVTYSDAMFHLDNAVKDSEQNGLNFIAETKRVELPVLWILHELGEI